MATKSIGPVVRAILLASDDVTDLVDVRICKEGGVLQDEALPYVTYSVDTNKPNRDVDGEIDDYTADFSITATALSYDDCDLLARRIAEALENADLSAPLGTGAELVPPGPEAVTVTVLDDPDIDDTPNGPIDLDGGEVFQSDVRCSLNYL